MELHERAITLLKTKVRDLTRRCEAERQYAASVKVRGSAPRGTEWRRSKDEELSITLHGLELLKEEKENYLLSLETLQEKQKELRKKLQTTTIEKENKQ